MKSLNGAKLAGFIKERQANQIKSLPNAPTLLILRDNSNPTITKYVELKKKYGQDIGANVIDFCAIKPTELHDKILAANKDPKINGIIVQLPLQDKTITEGLVNLIDPAKDVDGLGENAKYDSATATAISWLLTGYNIDLKDKRIALVGRGKLVGAPLYKMFKASNYAVDLFHRGDNLTKLNQYDIIISATGVPGLISDIMVKPGTCVVDAGTASENGVLKGDVSEAVHNRNDLLAITPKFGGVGPLTIACLFDHLIATI